MPNGVSVSDLYWAPPEHAGSLQQLTNTGGVLLDRPHWDALDRRANELLALPPGPTVYDCDRVRLFSFDGSGWSEGQWDDPGRLEERDGDLRPADDIAQAFVNLLRVLDGVLPDYANGHYAGEGEMFGQPLPTSAPASANPASTPNKP